MPAGIWALSKLAPSDKQIYVYIYGILEDEKTTTTTGYEKERGGKRGEKWFSSVDSFQFVTTGLHNNLHAMHIQQQFQITTIRSAPLQL